MYERIVRYIYIFPIIAYSSCMQHFPWRTLAAFITGLVVGSVAITYLLSLRADDGHFHSHDEAEGAYHVHADFLMIVKGTKVSLTADDYMSVSEKVLHPGVHLHDNNDTVIHFHARDITLVEFLASLDITLTQKCLTVNDETNCTDDTNILRLYVNNEDRSTDLETYVPQDDDSVLLYYGARDNSEIPAYLDAVTDDACIYTGTCPERGTAPAESCGLTCEL
jgi:hypothetical protein